MGCTLPELLGRTSGVIAWADAVVGRDSGMIGWTRGMVRLGLGDDHPDTRGGWPGNRACRLGSGPARLDD